MKRLAVLVSMVVILLMGCATPKRSKLNEDGTWDIQKEDTRMVFTLFNDGCIYATAISVMQQTKRDIMEINLVGISDWCSQLTQEVLGQGATLRDYSMSLKMYRKKQEEKEILEGTL